MQDRPTSVYIIACGDHIKIGIAVDPSRRVAELQTGAADRVHLYHSRQFKTRRDAYIVERAMHWRFVARKVRGEWFAVSPAEAKKVLAGARPRAEFPLYEPAEINRIAAEALTGARLSPSPSVHGD